MCIRDVVRWKANHCIIDARQYLQLRKLSLLLLLMLRKNRCISKLFSTNSKNIYLLRSIILSKKPYVFPVLQ